MSASIFVPGRQICRRFYTECIRPILNADLDGVPHAAALLGRGSEVLGYDDEMSADHNWEPRALIFLTDDDHERYGDRLREALDQQLPHRFAGHPTEHRVTTIRGYFAEQLRIDVDEPIRAVDWLTWPEARLIMITGGEVFADDIGLNEAIGRFSYYPDDVWYYLMFARWWRVHPEMNLVGRTGYVSDELGSSVMGARLVRDLMQLCFLMERRYAPYDKWFGTAFSRLNCGPKLTPVFTRVLRAENWRDREAALQAGYACLATMHNALRITDQVPTHIERMWDRPFGVLWGDFPDALRNRITDPEVLQIMETVGGIDQLRENIGIPRDRLLRLVEPPVPVTAG